MVHLGIVGADLEQSTPDVGPTPAQAKREVRCLAGACVLEGSIGHECAREDAPHWVGEQLQDSLVVLAGRDLQERRARRVEDVELELAPLTVEPPPASDVGPDSGLSLQSPQPEGFVTRFEKLIECEGLVAQHVRLHVESINPHLACLSFVGLMVHEVGSRTHGFGTRAKRAVEHARESVAAILGCRSEEVVFTSGATESNNLALLGLRAHCARVDRKHIVTTTIEHKAVLEPVRILEMGGFEVSRSELANWCQTNVGSWQSGSQVRQVFSPTVTISKRNECR